MAGVLRAKRDPSFEPVRVPGSFQREFPDGDPSATEATLNLTLAGTVTINRVTGPAPPGCRPPWPRIGAPPDVLAARGATLPASGLTSRPPSAS